MIVKSMIATAKGNIQHYENSCIKKRSVITVYTHIHIKQLHVSAVYSSHYQAGYKT